MKIVNPTNSQLDVVIDGNEYSIPANGTLRNISHRVANHWLSKIHGFILISEDDVVPVEPVKIKTAPKAETKPKSE